MDHIQHSSTTQKDATQLLVNSIPVPGIAGVHVRPLTKQECFGKRSFYGIWTFNESKLLETPETPMKDIPFYDVIVLNGLSRMIPSLKSYLTPHPFQLATSSQVKMGYYSKTPDNTPLLGPIKGIQGLYVCGGVSGFGVMCSQGAGISCFPHSLI